MTDQTNAVSMVQDLSTEQIDKFFETGGNELPSQQAETVQEGEEGTERETPPQETIDPQSNEGQGEQERVEEERHARNYQAAMKEERIRRQELQRQLEETKLQQMKMEQTFQKFVENVQRQAQPQPPSYEEDPLGHQQHKLTELQDYVIRQNEYLQKVQQAQQIQEQRNAFIKNYHAHAEAFAKTTPDFWDAYKYLITKRESEYMAAGLNLDEARQQIEYEEANVVSRALREGVNPAERAYAMAKASGYSKSFANANGTGGEESQREIATEAVKKAQQKLEEIQKGQSINKSLGTSSGKSDFPPTLANLSSLNEDELAEFVTGSGWSKLMKAG
jgi:hypothetical protein